MINCSTCCTCDLIYQLCTHMSWLIVSPGTEVTDSGLASVLNSLEFCLKPCGSEASILEDLSKAINLVHTRRNLVENDRVLLNRAHRAQQEYERYIVLCSLVFLTLAEYIGNYIYSLIQTKTPKGIYWQLILCFIRLNMNISRTLSLTANTIYSCHIKLLTRIQCAQVLCQHTNSSQKLIQYK